MTQTVSWLASQTADRYYQLHNILPIGLTLSLLDGAKLAPNDLISSTFVAGEEVFVFHCIVTHKSNSFLFISPPYYNCT